MEKRDRLCGEISGQRGMLTVEAALLVPLILSITVLIVLAMIYQFQSILMVAGLHQKGITQLHEVETTRLNLDRSLQIAGIVSAETPYELKGVAGIRILYQNAVLKPRHGWLSKLKPVTARSFHLMLPVNWLVYSVYKRTPEQGDSAAAATVFKERPD